MFCARGQIEIYLDSHSKSCRALCALWFNSFGTVPGRVKRVVKKVDESEKRVGYRPLCSLGCYRGVCDLWGTSSCLHTVLILKPWRQTAGATHTPYIICTRYVLESLWQLPATGSAACACPGDGVTGALFLLANQHPPLGRLGLCITLTWAVKEEIREGNNRNCGCYGVFFARGLLSVCKIFRAIAFHVKTETPAGHIAGSRSYCFLNENKSVKRLNSLGTSICNTCTGIASGNLLYFFCFPPVVWSTVNNVQCWLFLNSSYSAAETDTSYGLMTWLRRFTMTKVKLSKPKNDGFSC